MSKYNIFLTDNMYSTEGAELVGEAETPKEACKVLNDVLLARGEQEGRYWRFLFASNATFIDYGSWSLFGTIVPPLEMSDLN